MGDEPSRRALLSTSAVVGLSLLAGCDQQSQTTDTQSESTPTSTDSEPAHDPAVIRDTALEQRTVLHGKSVTVTVSLENTGHNEITRSVPLSVGGERVTTKTVTLAPGESRQIDVTGIPPETGTQVVEIGTRQVGTAVIRAPKPDAEHDVGAHYYPWYGAPLHDFNDGNWATESPSTPVLGSYNSTNPAVIEQHIDWCRRAGISWLNVSWWGPNREHDDRLREDILAHPRAGEVDWSILYETTGRLGSNPVELDDDSPQEQFTDDLRYLAANYFGRDNYKHIDDRPVVYVWVGQNLRGDVQAAYQNAVDAAGVRPYLVVDLPAGSGLNAHPIVDIADAVTTYTVYDPQNPTREAFVEAARSTYRNWYRAAEYVDVEVIPTAVPGFDDTEITHVQRDNEPVPSTPEIYEQTATAARKYADGPVLVTSFNEWYEDTQIEPSEDHGTAYVDLTANTIATGEGGTPTFDTETFTLEFERTVPESTMNPDIENGRRLTFMLDELTIQKRTGEIVLNADIGTNVDLVAFILGSYGPEQADGNTWRWLGGDTKTVVSVPSLPEAGHIELNGRGADEMSVTLKTDGEKRDTIGIAEQSDTYTVSLN